MTVHYEFICFDVPKVVQSPGCDHGHNEESRNGRDMKIDILDDYIRTPKWFQGLSDIYRSTGGLPNPPPPEVIGPHGPNWWKRRGGQGAAVRPSPPPSPNWTRRGRPPSFPPLSPSLSSPNPTRKREGVLLPMGVGLLLARPS